MFTRTIKKAWYEVPRIEVIDGKAEIAYEEVETWFPERWEKKNAKLNFIKKNEATYKMTIPEAKLIEYAFEMAILRRNPKMTNTLICNEENPVFCSLIPTNDAERAEVYNMAVNPGHKLSEMINKQIHLKNIYVEMVNGTDEITGETWSAPRVVLQDVNGETYSATSYGIYKACQRIVALWGPAPWDGIPVTVIQREANGRRTFTLKVD